MQGDAFFNGEYLGKVESFTEHKPHAVTLHNLEPTYFDLEETDLKGRQKSTRLLAMMPIKLAPGQAAQSWYFFLLN